MPPAAAERKRRRRALLIATGTYADPGLAKLRAPAGDVAALAKVLADRSIGAFDVSTVIDQPTEEVKRAIDAFFHDARLDDLLLLYVSGHGVLSQSRRFFFATVNTDLKWLRSTAVEDRFVNDVMQESRARSIVLVLDCCHSGAFAHGLLPKAGLNVNVEQRFEGRGRVTLTASTELEYAFEETATEDQSDISRVGGPAGAGSLFTRMLVEGLATGDADIDEDGSISVDELYDYVCHRMRERSPNQTPGMAGDVRGDILVAKSSRRPSLPADLVAAIESPLAGVREGAVAELARCLRSPTRNIAAAAETALRRLAADDSRRVSTAALAVLGEPAPVAEEAPAEPATPPEGEPAAPVDAVARRTLPRRGVLIAGGVVAVAAVSGAVALFAGGPAPSPPATPVATPYAFGSDGRQDIVMGLPYRSQSGSSVASGVVLIHAGPDSTTPAVITEPTAGVPGQPGANDRFGATMTSGDFNGDGQADLVVTVPGKTGVAVLYGSRGGSLRGGRFVPSRTQSLTRDSLAMPSGAGLAGGMLVGRHLNGDRFDDLAIGEPVVDRPGGGAIRILFGGAHGLVTAGALSLPPPRPGLRGFGRRLQAGDVDDDGNIDLVEGAPDDTVAGHLSYCPGTPHGPTSCTLLQSGPDTGTSSLAVADVNDDGPADIVQGDGDDVRGRRATGGEVRLWLGRSGGPPSVPTVITQRSPGMPANADDRAGDHFGAGIEAGDLDGNGIPDIVVSAPGEDDASGRVTVIWGSSDGFAKLSTAVLGNGGEPGRQFGYRIALLDLTEADAPDLVVVAAGAHAFADAVTVLTSPGEGKVAELRLQGLGGLLDAAPDDIRLGHAFAE